MTDVRSNRGADLGGWTAALGHPWTLPIDFGAVNVSTYTWLAEVRANTESVDPDATITVTEPTNFSILCTLSKAQVTALGVGTYNFTIDQVTPTDRQMFYGKVQVVAG